MARSSATWKPGQSGNPAGCPKSGQGIIRGLADELQKRGQSAKLAKILVKKALSEKADWRLQIAIYEFFFKVYQHEEIENIKTQLSEIKSMVNEPKIQDVQA